MTYGEREKESVGGWADYIKIRTLLQRGEKYPDERPK